MLTAPAAKGLAVGKHSRLGIAQVQGCCLLTKVGPGCLEARQLGLGSVGIGWGAKSPGVALWLHADRYGVSVPAAAHVH